MFQLGTNMLMEDNHFDRATVTPQATELAESFFRTMSMHLRNANQEPSMSDSTANKVKEALVEIFRAALFLRARLEVAPFDHEYVWAPIGQSFDQREMTEVRGWDAGVSSVALCILPGIKYRGDNEVWGVKSKAQVFGVPTKA